MIFRNSVLLAFFSGLSLLLGIARDRLLSHYVGVGPMLDVYNASFRIPDLIYGIMLSFVSAVTVVPFITKAIHDNDKKELEVRFNSLLFFFSGILIVVSSLTPKEKIGKLIKKSGMKKEILGKESFFMESLEVWKIWKIPKV